MSAKIINPKKASIVSQLTDLLSQAKSVAVVDYKGLKVNQATELRRAIKKAGGHIEVTKNTLFTIASGRDDLNLEGPSAFVFSLTDEVSAIKAVFDFAKKNSLPTFKLGLLAKNLLSAEQITALANLPSKEVLIAKTVGTLKSPLFKLSYALNWNLVKLVRTLEEVRLSHVRRQSI